MNRKFIAERGIDMNNRIRIFALIMVFAMVITMVACGKKEEIESEGNDMDQSQAGHQDDIFDVIESIGQENSDAEVGNYEVPPEMDFIWEDVENGVALTRYTGTITAVQIPSQLGGKDVVEIHEGAFSYVPVVGIKIPDTVVTICDSAFFYNMTLLEVYFGKGVRVVEENAFHGCSALRKVELNEGLESLEYMSFALTSSLTQISLPDSVKVMDDGVFIMSGLREITVPGSVERIGKQAFAKCAALETVVILEGVKSIAYNAFSICDELNSITVPGSVTEIQQDAFSDCAKLTLYVSAGSEAEAHARENGIPYKVK